jgi:hypothetical protein
MKLPITNLSIATIVSVALAAFIPYALLVPRPFAFELLDAIAVALAVGDSASYFREAWAAMKQPVHKMLSAHYIVIGVFFVNLSMGLLFSGMLYWRITTEPTGIISSAPILFTRWLAVMGLVFFILTTYSRAGIVVVGAYKWPTIITVLTFIAVLFGWWLIAHG